MVSMSVIIAFGPGLTMAMAALALFVVHYGFSPTRHALLWTGGTALGAAQWGVMAAQGLAGLRPPLGTGPAVDVLGLLSLLLIAAGFGVRAGGRVPRWLPVAGLLTAVVLLPMLARPPSPLRAAVLPLATVFVLLRVAALMPRPDRRLSASEVAVLAVLVAIALVQAAAAAAALAEAAGRLPDRRLYQIICLFTVEPAGAALALAALLLIASDFAAELKRLAHTDPLTGVLNREGFDQQARLHWQRGRGRPFAVALADIDRFKRVNDEHGHQVGDRALARVAAHLADGLGRDGAVARLGGEEFALLLPGLDAAGALARIEPLRRALADVRLDGHPGLRLSASFGVAQRGPGDTLGGLLERADVALYRSKRAGRDRSTLAPPVAAGAEPAG